MLLIKSIPEIYSIEIREVNMIKRLVKGINRNIENMTKNAYKFIFLRINFRSIP